MSQHKFAPFSAPPPVRRRDMIPTAYLIGFTIWTLAGATITATAVLAGEPVEFLILLGGVTATPAVVLAFLLILQPRS